MEKMTPDNFISQLYRQASLIPLEEFSTWALNLLQQVIPFDGAVWGTGHISTQAFHTQTNIDVPIEIFDQLKKHLAINPIFEKLLLNEGGAVDMRDVLSDKAFYQSELYQQCFKPFSIERILSSIHIEQRSGIFTLLSLYRYHREQSFTVKEKQIQSRLLYHLLSAASHRQLLALTEKNSEENSLKDNYSSKSAICDSAGIYHCVDPSFLDIIDSHLTLPNQQRFPFAIKANQQSFTEGSLQFEQQNHGDLYRLTVRVQNRLDHLTAREKQVVEGICQGRTFKQIARELQLSPSTVSNHLYRIYLKLDIHNRSELVDLAKNKFG